LAQTSFRFRGALEKEDLAPEPEHVDQQQQQEAWNGTGDNRIILQNGGNSEGAIFVGKLFISSAAQPMRLIFDTGSDYLAVTSELCSHTKASLAQQEKASLA